MKRSAHIVFALGIVLAPLVAAATPTNSPQFAKSELRQMMHEARTPAQYRVLADYFRGQQQHFEQQAQSEKEEWVRRSANVMGPAAKYPRPVDSSKNRYEYFTFEAQEMQRQAAHYESLSSSGN